MGSFTNTFGKSPKVALIEAFAENPGYDLSIPDILRIAGRAISRRAAYMHVVELLKMGIIIESRKQGKCTYYKFNDNDPRGKALIFLEKVLTIGSLEQAIRQDETLRHII